ncbi:hypothetical protein WG66_004409 [Moniliophthora roreri]|nr:hypothetical protein WG66_004409 [Moniliophthora roreri]
MARAVTFWRLLRPVAIQPISELPLRIANAGTDEQKISFSEKARDWRQDDVVVKVNLDLVAVTEFNGHRRAHSWLAYMYQGTECVNNLFQQVIEERLVLAKIEREMPEALIEVFLYWTPEKEAEGTALDQRLDYGTYRMVSLQEVKVPAQSKSRAENSNLVTLRRRSGNVLGYSALDYHIQTRHLPNLYITLFASISAHALMGLFPTEHVAHALQFTPLEYSSFIRGAPNLQSRSWPVLDQALQEFFFVMSNGHIGAIETLLNMAAKANKVEDPDHRHLPYLSHDDFFKCFETPDDFMVILKVGSGSFCRGLSLFPAEYSDILRVLIAVECGGATSYIMFSSLSNALKEASEDAPWSPPDIGIKLPLSTVRFNREHEMPVNRKRHYGSAAGDAQPLIEDDDVKALFTSGRCTRRSQTP